MRYKADETRFLTTQKTKTMKQTQTDQATPLHTQGEWEWKKITKKQLIIGLKNYGFENGDYRKDNQCGQIAQIHGWDGEQSSELSQEDYANAELIVKAVNERQALLDLINECNSVLTKCEYWIDGSKHIQEEITHLKFKIKNLKQ